MFKLLLASVLFNLVKCQQTNQENEDSDLEPEAEMDGFFSSLDFQVLASPSQNSKLSVKLSPKARFKWSQFWLTERSIEN